jgi:hypothetical protein
MPREPWPQPLGKPYALRFVEWIGCMFVAVLAGIIALLGLRALGVPENLALLAAGYLGGRVHYRLENSLD